MKLLLCALAFPMLAFASEEKFDSTISILNERGETDPSAPSALTAHTVEVSVGPGFSFNPDSVTIGVGDTVHWTWVSNNHTVTSGSPSCMIDGVYCSPSNVNCPSGPTSNTGAQYSHTFASAGTYSYLCRVHCGAGMTGTVFVVAPFVNVTTTSRTSMGHFVFEGKTLPRATVTIQAAPDLFSEFVMIGTATADDDGVFQYDDGSDPMRRQRFYRANY